MRRRPITQVMSAANGCVSPAMTMTEVAVQMAQLFQSCVVVGDSNKPVGIITERDVVRALANGASQYTKLLAGAVMSSPPVTVGDRVSVEDALSLARARRLRHLVVVNAAGEFSGVVTQTDMVRAYLDEIQAFDSTLESEIKSRTRDLETSNRHLLNLAMEDSLMCIGNRRAMEVDLQHTQAGAERHGDSYQLALFDIDLFKRYNDRYGHQSGDLALKRVAEIIQGELRETDRLYRYGGEELLLLMPKVDLDHAALVADRVRAALEQAAIQHEDSPFGVLTVSAGVAEGSAVNWAVSLKKTDEALYRAKAGGRNTVSVAR